MSLDNSIGINSTTSSTTISTKQLDEEIMDPSNILYNDRQHYQNIFTNDSRFFDTSLHLFKSYRTLGYINLDNKKSKKISFSSSINTLKVFSSGFNNNRWPSKEIEFSSNDDIHGNFNKKLNRSFFSRDQDHSTTHTVVARSRSLKTKRENSPTIVSHQRSSNYPVTNGDQSDDSDIIVTRL